MDPKQLPIYGLREAIVEHLRKAPRLILQAPTGSGKSTQVPQILLDSGLVRPNKKIIILQPRRIAARLLATRVASERNQSRLGDEVGYKVRFENVTSQNSRIIYVTEGILLRQICSDPTLNDIDAILFDEFHERHIYGDISLARAIEIQKKRPELKLVVMSATIETKDLENFLQPCSTLVSEGRTFPIQVEYLEDKRNLSHEKVWDLATKSLEELILQDEEENKISGNVLIFMPGAYEINQTIRAISNSRSIPNDFEVLPLHGELPLQAQDAALRDSSNRRKIIVATNVAETSLTIPGVNIVIDSGLARIAKYDPYRGINTLLIERISIASANQRCGRAGRTAPGHCVRLWPESENQFREIQEQPEIKRLDLSEVVLILKAAGVTNLANFRWFDPPEPKSISRALLLLQDLGAIENPEGPLMDIGKRMLAFPVHPRYARMLLFAAAAESNCVEQVALITALTQTRNLLQRAKSEEREEYQRKIRNDEKTDKKPNQKTNEKNRSDFDSLIQAFLYAKKFNFDLPACREVGVHSQVARQVNELWKDFLRIARKENLVFSNSNDAEISDPHQQFTGLNEELCRCILLGFSDHVARRMDSGTLRCEIVHNRRGVLARESAVQDSNLLVATEIKEIQKSKEDDLTVLLSLATAIKEEWLKELFPTDFKEVINSIYDTTTRRVLSRKQTIFRDLVLREASDATPPLEESAKILAREVASGNCPLSMWDHKVEQWIQRINTISTIMPELGIAPITNNERNAIVEQICYGSVSYKEIKNREVWPTLKSWLSTQQSEWLEKYVPERLELPNGKKMKLRYEESKVVLSARIQDLYEVTGELTIAANRQPLTIEVLAPNHRAIQVTSSLKTFWKEVYPQVKPQLMRKYPKHEWR